MCSLGWLLPLFKGCVRNKLGEILKEYDTYVEEVIKNVERNNCRIE